MASRRLHRTVKVGLNKSLVIDLPRDARDILVSNPVIADAVIRTPRRIYVTGVAVGQSNVIVFDQAGQQIVSLDLEVERDTSTLVARCSRRLIPDSDIKVEIVSDNIVLSGTVKNAADARKAQDIANIFANGGANAQPAARATASAPAAAPAVPAASASRSTHASSRRRPRQRRQHADHRGRGQVQLKVTVAEVQRNIAKQLGVELSGNISIGSFSTCAVRASCSTTGNPVRRQRQARCPTTPLDASATHDGVSSLLGATLSALEQTGMIKTLAEPTLTAISGETASFLAGGEFPVPTGRDQTATSPSSSSPSASRSPSRRWCCRKAASACASRPRSRSCPRRAPFTLNDISPFPASRCAAPRPRSSCPPAARWCSAACCRTASASRSPRCPASASCRSSARCSAAATSSASETELVIIVTPYLVKPVPRSALATPDDGFAPASDAQAIFLGNINRVYGVQGSQAPGRHLSAAHFGFIFE